MVIESALPSDHEAVQNGYGLTEGAFRQESRRASSQIRPFPALHQKSRASEMLKDRFGGPPSWNAQCKVLKSRALPRWPKHTASWSLGLHAGARKGRFASRGGSAGQPCMRSRPQDESCAIPFTPHPFQDWLARNLPKRLIDRMIDARLGLLPTRE
jgi:hypothetical protein